MVIAKMDATENDPSPNFLVQGFPTIYLVKSGTESNGNEQKEYQGDRSFKDLLKFVQDNVGYDTSLSKIMLGMIQVCPR